MSKHSTVIFTSVEDLSYTPSESEQRSNTNYMEATGRTSWKTIKGKGEAVWPPLLEATLLEALQEYEQNNKDFDSYKIQGRFPRRNQFISDYILKTTGKSRTPKQVGSRLQQLRGTCTKKWIMRLLVHHNNPNGPPPASRSYDISPDTNSNSTSPSYTQRHIIPITICLQNQLWPVPIPLVNIPDDFDKNMQTIQLSPSIINSSKRVQWEQDSRSSSILSVLSTVITLCSSQALASMSTFSVYSNECCKALHTETVYLSVLPSHDDRQWRYSVNLVPQYWETLCKDRDTSKYTISHQVKRLQTVNPNTTKTDANNTIEIIEMLYQFVDSKPSSQVSNIPIDTRYQSNGTRSTTPCSSTSSIPYIY